MFLKVIYARARVYSWACEDFCIYSWACEGKGKRKGRRKEKEKVRAALVLLHEGAKRRIRAGGARGGKRKESRERRRCETGATCSTVKRRGHKRAPQHAHQGTIGNSRELRRRDLLDYEKEGG